MRSANKSQIIEKWNKRWEEDNLYKVDVDKNKKKYYCLDMFPYPSGAGLHVGHPLGYIATDIICRYKRLKGYNVLHAMGFDSFGLPAEQFAIETGQHPALTTEENIDNFKSQLKNMGLSLDVSREVKTSDSDYYKWTQWIFSQLFNHWYDNRDCKAKPIDELISIFSLHGSDGLDYSKVKFTSEQWKQFSSKDKSDILMDFRLAYLSYSNVNWCPELGTVLANDEVINGLSERGGYPVVKKKMKQWTLRITAYANRLNDNLSKLEWSDSLKEMQKNWIGRSYGMSIDFKLEGNATPLTIFTSKPETIFGVTFLAVSPEDEIVEKLVTEKEKNNVTQFLEANSAMSELDRKIGVNNPKGIFTGSYAIHPITGDKVPIWLADYVLSGYGSGAVMGVPYGDERDFTFASKYKINVKEIYDTTGKFTKICNSDFLDGLTENDARKKINVFLIESRCGVAKTSFKIRDAVFGRQRYWGEPIPIYYDEENIPHLVDESELPLKLPKIDKYLPTADGQPPLARAADWLYKDKYPIEYTTMPGWAGSSWYFLRYMDPNNKNAIADKRALSYWREVDFYMGGSEHATGHLLYARFWNLFLYDIGLVPFDEPFKKIINQGMIQGRSSIIYRIKGTNNFVCSRIKDNYEAQPIHVDINFVDKNDRLDVEKFRSWRRDYEDSEFIYDGDSFYCDYLIEKMSKSKYNTVNPDDIIEQYGADVFRLYEMFMGPIQQSKPWDLKNIDGISKFLSKVWRLFYNESNETIVTDEAASKDELRVLHKAIKKVSNDIERLSFNTAITALMVCTNDLTKMQCHKKSILKELLLLLSPFAVYNTQELWTESLKLDGNILDQKYPTIEEAFIVDEYFTCPVTINGKVRTRIDLPNNCNELEAKNVIFSNEVIHKWIANKEIKRFIFVRNKIANIVI